MYGVFYGRITDTIITIQILKLILNRRVRVILWIPSWFTNKHFKVWPWICAAGCESTSHLCLYGCSRGIERVWGWDSSVSQPYNVALESWMNGRPVCSLKDWPEHPALCVCVYIYAWMEHNQMALLGFLWVISSCDLRGRSLSIYWMANRKIQQAYFISVPSYFWLLLIHSCYHGTVPNLFQRCQNTIVK